MRVLWSASCEACEIQRPGGEGVCVQLKLARGQSLESGCDLRVIKVGPGIQLLTNAVGTVSSRRLVSVCESCGDRLAIK
jgi:hypothetical protein